MAHSYCIELTPDERAQLLVIARSSIAHGLITNQPLEIEHARLTGTLMQRHGSFVTLTQSGTLRGCVGDLKGAGPLAQNIAVTAFSAAIHDTRFAPLSAVEIDRTRIEISVLSKLEPMEARTYSELLAQLRPLEDGLLVEDGHRRATLLPKVWERLSDPQQFVGQLMAKAGLPEGYWSDSIRFSRYTAICFAEHTEEAEALA